MIGLDPSLVAVKVDATPANATSQPEDSQLAIALRRVQTESCAPDPQGAVAAFNSAF